MRIAVLSDVHSNLEALDAVLSVAREEECSATFVLGDIVGYGADPVAVVDRLASLPSVHLIAGNHDLAATGRFDVSWFNSVAAKAIRWTTRQLSPEALRLLQGLEPRGAGDGAVLVHGSVVDPAAEYVLHVRTAARSFDAEPFPLCFFGHTHLPCAYVKEGERVIGRALGEGARVALGADRRFMLNPGSVGQPRDGDPRASFMIFDGEAGEAIVHRVPYEIERAQAKIRDAGLPGVLADRLAVGQ